MKPYDYAQRSGVRRLTWAEFASLSSHLAELLEPFHPRIILGVARAGLFPATSAACALRCELFPIRLTRRVNDRVMYDVPVWRVPVPAEVAGRVVAVVDEIADTGQTLSMAAQKALDCGADQVITASLVAHTWADPQPMITALTTDEFVVFPWDEQVLINGKWVAHPEVEAGLQAQSQDKGD